MSSTITTSVVTGGSNTHATTASEINGSRTDWASAGVIGAITNTSGQAPSTGAFAVNAQSPPAMFVDVGVGTAYIQATPAGQSSQILRVNMSAIYTSYVISVNTSGSTKYDWIYLQVDPTKANNPAADASDVTALYTSRSSSNTVDNGSPPTYGTLLAVVTVANGASSIANSNIADKRTASRWPSPSLTSNPYKFSVYRSAALTSSVSAAVMPCDTKLFDTGNNVDIVTNKGRFTATLAGFYCFGGFHTTSVAGGAGFGSGINKNGTQIVGVNQIQGATGGFGAGGNSFVFVQLVANDYVEFIYYNSGNGFGAGSNQNGFWGYLVSAS